MAAARGQVWEVTNEHGETTEVLIVSDEGLRIGVATALEITHDYRAIRRFHVELEDVSGVMLPAFAKVESLQMIAEDDCVRQLGAVSAETMTAVEDALRILLRLF